MDKKSMELFLDSEVQTFCRLADDIWEYAETAFEEIKSADALCSTLESFGFTIEKNIAGIPTAFCGTYGNGKPVIGLLAEYDALSNLSQKSGQAVIDYLEGNKSRTQICGKCKIIRRIVLP